MAVIILVAPRQTSRQVLMDDLEGENEHEDHSGVNKNDESASTSSCNLQIFYQNAYRLSCRWN